MGNYLAVEGPPDLRDLQQDDSGCFADLSNCMVGYRAGPKWLDHWGGIPRAAFSHFMVDQPLDGTSCQLSLPVNMDPYANVPSHGMTDKRQMDRWISGILNLLPFITTKCLLGGCVPIAECNTCPDFVFFYQAMSKWLHHLLSLLSRKHLSWGNLLVCLRKPGGPFPSLLKMYLEVIENRRGMRETIQGREEEKNLWRRKVI